MSRQPSSSQLDLLFLLFRAFRTTNQIHFISFSAFVDRHFGPDSDFSKLFLARQPQIEDVKEESGAAFANDDRLFIRTKNAIRARRQAPEIKYPEPSWNKTQTSEWWKSRRADLTTMQGQWSGPLPKQIESSLSTVERLVQGVSVRITKVRDIGMVPVVIYFHGGGFAGGSFNDRVYRNYLGRLAAVGKCIVIAVDPAPIEAKSFSAALNDCVLVTLAAANGKITSVPSGPVLLAGNSIGGTLALATAIKANREGWIEKISGIYTICPMSDPVASGPKYPSMAEFDGYYISKGYLQACVNMVKDELTKNKKLFPISATRDEMRGLPPTKIVVYQLDMLRDMGIAMHFKLMKAGVQASFNICSGGVHDQQLFTMHSPEVTESSICDLAQFSNYTGLLAGLDLRHANNLGVNRSVRGKMSRSRSAKTTLALAQSRSDDASVSVASTRSKKSVTSTRSKSVTSTRSKSRGGTTTI